ncbi:MAG: hypothetical protein ACXVYM_01390 [Gaiellaceae bacterium]
MSPRRRWTRLRLLAVSAGLLVTLNVVLFVVQATTAAGGGGIQSLIGNKLVRADLGVWQNGQVVDVGIDQGVVRSVAADSIVLVEKDGKVVQIGVSPSTPVIGARLGFVRPRMLVRVFRQPSSGPAYQIEVLARVSAPGRSVP